MFGVVKITPAGPGAVVATYKTRSSAKTQAKRRMKTGGVFTVVALTV